MLRNRLAALLAAVLVLTAFTSPALAYTLKILHTNDVHAHIQPFNKYGSACAPEKDAEGECFGGAARIAAAVRAERQAGGNVAAVDAGDWFQGSLLYTGFKGEIIAESMNAVGYDVMALGNHEFDDGPAELARFLELAEFDVISSGPDFSREPAIDDRVDPYVIKRIGGRRIGFIGALGEQTPQESSPGETVPFFIPEPLVRDAVRELRAKGVDIIILVSHLGFDRERAVAKSIPGIDIIVGGHTHTYLNSSDDRADGPYPVVETSGLGEPVLLVTNGEFAKRLGKLEVVFDDRGVAAEWSGGPVLLDASVPGDADVAAMVADRVAALDAYTSAGVGVSLVDLHAERSRVRHFETNMGNLVADALLADAQGVGAQACMINGGGIRASLAKGDITLGDVLTVLPFANTSATVTIPGTALRAALENAVSRAESVENGGTGRFAQVAGLYFVWDPARPAGERVIHAEIRGENGYEAVRPDGVYRIVTTNFQARGGDGYDMFRDAALEKPWLGKPVDRIVADYIKAHSPVSPKVEGRIKRVLPKP